MYRNTHKFTGASIPLCQSCILHITPICTKFTNFSFCFRQIYKFTLIFMKLTFFAYLKLFSYPLFWSWCIYASCFTSTGRPCKFNDTPKSKTNRNFFLCIHMRSVNVNGCERDVPFALSSSTIDVWKLVKGSVRYEEWPPFYNNRWRTGLSFCGACCRS